MVAQLDSPVRIISFLHSIRERCYRACVCSKLSQSYLELCMGLHVHSVRRILMAQKNIFVPSGVCDMDH